jgi:hypothetical protein
MSFRDINFQLKQFINDIFIETGTYHGETAFVASNLGFKKVISIELQQHLLSVAIKKCKKCNNIEFHLGDSPTVLKKLLPLIDTKTTFWLDAHIDDCNIIPNITPNIRKCPLLEELEIISNSKRNDHTILIDDIRIFGMENVWGEKLTLQTIINELYKINPNYNISFIDGYTNNDIIVAKI